MRDKQGNFFERVWAVVEHVPYGRVTTYGAIANFLGTKQSSRMVGWAMNASHNAYSNIPAHRVVNRKGLLTGKHHFSSPDLMKELLESEGVHVENDLVTRFEDLFWDPAKEL
ncbi:MAG: MGMT family protein [Bacteroidales bacterium]|nr:MGMT family protein [Bacteroidales bacterium]